MDQYRIHCRFTIDEITSNWRLNRFFHRKRIESNDFLPVQSHLCDAVACAVWHICSNNRFQVFSAQHFNFDSTAKRRFSCMLSSYFIELCKNQFRILSFCRFRNGNFNAIIVYYHLNIIESIYCNSMDADGI